LTLGADPGKCLRFRLAYRRDLYDPDAARAIVDRMVRLLETIASDPNKPLGQVSVLVKDEERGMVEEWNQTQRAYPNKRRIQELFEEQVERTPDRTALVFGEKRVSYQELNREANRLAHYLREKGVGPEEVVGIYCRRSERQVVAVL